MKIYIFELCRKKICKSVEEVIEKPKIYMSYRRCFKKSEEGISRHERVFLTKDDVELAKMAFKREITDMIAHMQEEIVYTNDRIESAQRRLEELEKIKDVEEIL